MSKDMEFTNKELFQMCMKGKWNEVVETYKKDKRAHKAKVTRTGDTALHVAVTDGQEEVVSQLVKLLLEHTKDALRIWNDRRNTALHFAASIGSVKMIEDIAKSDPSLVSVRNVDGETPLFLAAFHGRKQEFFTLHYIFHMKPGTEIPPNKEHYWRRNDGDTILHSAIAGDNFDLAFQIIHLYGNRLVNSVNESGATPLHLLASKPSAFKSGSRLGRFERFIYSGILVEELKVERNYCQQKCNTTRKEKNNYPKNYQTIVDLMEVTKKGAQVVTHKCPLPHHLIEKRAQEDQIRTGDLEAIGNTDPYGVVKTNSSGSEAKAGSHQLFPANYKCCVDFIKFVFVAMLVIFGRGTTMITRLRRKKEKHEWSIQIMNELLWRASIYEYEYNGSMPQFDPLTDKSTHQEQETSPYSVIHEEGTDTLDSNNKEQPITKAEAPQQEKGDKKDKKSEIGIKMETPILIAAKNGITEMVEKILELFPVAAHDMDNSKKNIVLLAVENRQPHLYELLIKRKVLKETLFRKVDNEGNSALHLAAKLGDHKPWLIPGDALQMYWEIKWYSYVKESMPSHFFRHYNKYHQTPRDIFTKTHEDLVKSGGEWLKQTSESCSVVAALIATVAFATSSAVPGGVKEDTGVPTFESTAAFKVFAISSFIALCCSVTAVVVFLSILTSRYQEQDFGKNLPRKLILGLTSLFMSITSMLVSFCAGHFLVLKNKLKYAALPIYAVTCLPVTLFAFAQFPLYFDLIWATFKKVPQRSFKAT